MSAFGTLRAYARKAEAAESCAMCGVALGAGHRHLAEPATRKIVCSCQACALLFENPAGRFRTVPREWRRVGNLEIPWDELGIPIDLAFFFRSSAEERVIAIYPSPAGPVESLLPLDGFPALGQLKADVEAVLVSRRLEMCLVAPIDRCYELVGLVRKHWRGMSGGPEVWTEIARFLEEWAPPEARRTEVQKVADAILYEGYTLYPYRPSSIKNQKRFHFGVLYPPAWDGVSSSRTECLAVAPPSAELQVTARFLQLSGEVEEREAALRRRLDSEPVSQRFDLGIALELELSAVLIEGGLFRITLLARNISDRKPQSHDEALSLSPISLHSILHLSAGEFVSLLDPPEALREHAAACRNEGTWPVLAGEGRGTMLSSPIILYDYPRVAPESPGDLFDSTEIDEILSLRILAMTDAEKDEVRRSDPRSRRILERAEALTPGELIRLHGRLSHG